MRITIGAKLSYAQSEHDSVQNEDQTKSAPVVAVGYCTLQMHIDSFCSIPVIVYVLKASAIMFKFSSLKSHSEFYETIFLNLPKKCVQEIGFQKEPFK